MNYDVFLSCKSEDYKIAEEVYQYLTDNGFHVFLSSKELRRMKDSEYMDAISDALDSAYHLIVLSSSASNIKSKWVKFEWSTFLNEVLSERKKGQIMTLVNNISVAELPIQLRHYEMFHLDDYKERILSYIETPDYIQRRLEAEERKKLEAERRRIEEEKRLEKEIKKKELIRLAEEYHQKASALQSIEGKKILHTLKELGVINRNCPVCEESIPILKTFCPRCGFQISPILGIPELSYLFEYKDEQLSISKKLFEKSLNFEREYQKLTSCIEETNKLLEEKTREFICLNDKYKSSVEDINMLKSDNSRFEEMNSNLERELEIRAYTIEKLENELNSLKNELNELRERVKWENSYIKKTSTSANQKPSTLHQSPKPSQMPLAGNGNDVRKRKFKTFNSKEELSKFISKFCRVTPNNKKSISEIKLNIDSFIHFLNLEYGINLSSDDIRACSNYQTLKNMIFNIAKQLS